MSDFEMSDFEMSDFEMSDISQIISTPESKPENKPEYKPENKPEYKPEFKPEYKETCPAYAFQEASVCVPVEVIPFAKAGSVKTFCKGDPIVTSGCIECPGSINNKCHFTITQKICVKVPVEFGANTLIGSPHIKCDKASSHDICRICDKD